MRAILASIFILISATLAAQGFRAVNDTIDLVPGVPVTVYLLANDTIPVGDSVKVTNGTNFTNGMVVSTWKNKGWFSYVANQWGYNRKAESSYTVTDYTIQKVTVAKIVCRIHDHSYDSLAINNIDANFNASGSNFLLFFADPNAYRGFVVPKGSGKKTFFTSSFWIGGEDQDSNVYFAGERYRQGNFGKVGTQPDFYAGPVMDSANYSVYQDTIWNKIWNLKKTEIDYHRLHWQDIGYHPVRAILTWPGNGDVNLGEAPRLAPFFDRNNDGIYNPMDGDYPLIRGDQALYFIFNENRGPHLESGGTRTMKAEVHAMAYGWDMPGDSAFNNTLFLNYQVFNRSQQAYYNSYLGFFEDIDIGNMIDDYTGCDVSRGSIIGYNGKAIDTGAYQGAYGAHPPAQSVTFLAGPKLDPAGTDRPRVDGSGHQLCNASINGTGFGDGIPDNERMGLTNFIRFYYPQMSIPPFMWESRSPRVFYNFLRSKWVDSTNINYGGYGHIGYGGYGPSCRFLFPGESDTLNWGLGGQSPNGQKNWTERSAGIPPGDIRGMGSSGPFTFRPGEMKELDLALVFARDYTSPDTLASVTKLMQMIDIVRHAFITNKLPGGQSFTDVKELPAQISASCSVYPNPAASQARVTFNLPLGQKTLISIFDDQGRLIRSEVMASGSIEKVMDISGVSPGLYLLVIRSSTLMITRKLTIIH